MVCVFKLLNIFNILALSKYICASQDVSIIDLRKVNMYVSRIFCYILTFDPAPKMLFLGDTPEGIDTFQWPVIERDRVGGLRLMIWDKVKVSLCHYSHAPKESNL